MHEVGIAESIIQIIELEVEKNNASTVLSAKIIVGEFTGVVKESLLFALDIIKKDSSAKDANFIVEVKKTETYCTKCEKMLESNEKNNFWCPICESPLQITGGKELSVEYIDLE